MNNLNKILSFILILLFGLFCFSLFKNIQYPLLWNDEAETAMFAARILKYGYPKIHDGKNLLYQNPASTRELLINAEFDAPIESDWLQYYIASLALIFAQTTSNIYTKTGLLRIPFALIGLIGTAVVGLSVIPLFKKRTHKLFFLILFVFLETLSIPLILHLKEARYYSLVVFFVSSILFLHVRFYIFRILEYQKYIKTLIILLLLLLLSSRTAFFAVLPFLLIHAGIQIFAEIISYKSLTQLYTSRVIKKRLFPIIITAIISIPYLIFFRTFYFAGEMSKYFHFNTVVYLQHILHILNFFWESEFLPLAITLKGFIALLWLNRNSKKITSEVMKKIHTSFLFSLFFIVYILLMSRVPYYMFTRYFVVLQPVIITIILLDVFVVFEMVLHLYRSVKTIIYITILISLLGINFTLTLFKNEGRLKGHIYELTHQYKGPLDFIIPYIQQNFKNPENLVIATNYEEFSYMFYLGSKVTIGYVGNNLEKDIKIQPDIIIYRNGWGSNPNIFNYLLSKTKYKAVLFPVFNYPLNNIPEFNFAISHLFKTKLATNEEEKLKIFVRERLIQK